MRKLISAVIVIALVLSLCTLSAYAANGERRGRTPDCGFTCSEFIDADGDGVCDSCPNGGVCQYNGTGRGAGRGICRGCCGACRMR